MGKPVNLVRLLSNTPLQEVKVVAEPNFQTYTVVNINPYTLEEQLIMYPLVVVHGSVGGCPSVIIDVE